MTKYKCRIYLVDTVSCKLYVNGTQLYLLGWVMIDVTKLQDYVANAFRISVLAVAGLLDW